LPESSDADALRHQAALAVPAALALPLSAEELGRVMGVVRRQELAGTRDGAGSLADCVAVVGGFLRWVYPRLRLARGDDAWGLGGVEGVRERLVPGGGWARVGSWKELAGAVAVAGEGASAVVLVSGAGRRPGHALVLHETTVGPWWADPRPADPDGVVTAGLPGDVRSAVAAWAVVVDRNGRVVPPPEPGSWAAPEPVGGEWMLTDPPLRHDFRAMGVEIERHNVRLFWPGGRDLPEKIILLQSSDGRVRVVVDHSQAWLSEDGALYESREDMQARTGAVTGDWVEMAVPEIVTVPWAVAGEPGRPDPEAVRAWIRDADWRLNRAPRARRSPPEHGSSLAELFPRDSGWVINPRFKNVQVARPDGLSNGAPLYLQVSVGVPLGGGVLAALDELERGMDLGAPHAEGLRAAAGFGWGVARLYMAYAVRAVLSPEGTWTFTPNWDAADVITVVEVMALAFHQLGAVLDYQAKQQGNMKQRIPVAARQSLHEIWSELGRRQQTSSATGLKSSGGCSRKISGSCPRVSPAGTMPRTVGRQARRSTCGTWKSPTSTPMSASAAWVNFSMRSYGPRPEACGSGRRPSMSRRRIPAAAWTGRVPAGRACRCRCRWSCRKCAISASRSTTGRGCATGSIIR
jgi:hypothetical protein